MYAPPNKPLPVDLFFILSDFFVRVKPQEMFPLSYWSTDVSINRLQSSIEYNLLPRCKFLFKQGAFFFRGGLKKRPNPFCCCGHGKFLSL